MAQPKLRSTTIAPPVMGLTSKQPISQMNPLYAVELENLFPTGNTLDLRNGFTLHATASAVWEDLFEYIQETGTRYFLGVYSGACKDITSSGAGTDITGATSPYPTRHARVNFRNRIFIKDIVGARPVYVWTGAGNLAAAAFVGPGGADTDINWITSYKSRLYFSEYEAASIWYTEFTDAVTGTLIEFDLTSLFKLGGKILWIGSMSFASSGLGAQQFFVVISDQGEILMYQGSYPDDATWSIVGQYYIPPPAGPFCCFQFGQDVIIITIQGVVALSDVVNAGPQNTFKYFSDEVNALIAADIRTALAANYQNYLDGIVYPNGNYLLINIRTANAVWVQYVMNLETKAWSKFTGQNGFAWTLFNNRLYFSGYQGTQSNYYVMKADDGYFDTDITDGSGAQSRTVLMRPAYNYFGAPAQVKQFTEAVPILYMSEGLSLTMDVDIDYADTTPTNTVSDTSDTSYKLYKPKMGLNGIGKAASLRIEQTVTTKRMSLQAIEVFWNEGEVR